mgnify:CR=1 FL=1
MSLLTIVQDAADRLSIPEPISAFTSSDTSIRELVGLAQQEGKELARRASWQSLTKEKTFTTTAAAVQTSAVPSDFDWYIPGTAFNRTRRRQMVGPLSQSDWQRIQASLVTLVNPGFRFRGDDILITPTPAAGETVAYEYVTLNWCTSIGGTPQSSWQFDSDVAVLDEELITLGLIWRFKKTNGFDYSEEFRSYDMQVTKAILRDGALPFLSTNLTPVARTPTSPLIPDTIVFS